jgi:hypothetical protein
VPPATYTLNIEVIGHHHGPVPYAEVKVIDGYRKGEVFVVGRDGKLTVTGMSGEVTLLARSRGCTEDRQTPGVPQPGARTSVHFQIHTKGTFSKKGRGTATYDVPRCISSLRFEAAPVVHNAGFHVRLDGVMLINERLPKTGTTWLYSWSLRRTGGGTLEIYDSGNVAWMVRQQ